MREAVQPVLFLASKPADIKPPADAGDPAAA
jgi:hypothetical protein